MKRILAALALFAALAITPITAHAQSKTCTASVYSGQTGLQASYIDASTGAVYPNAVFAIARVNLSSSSSTAVVTVAVFDTLATEKACLAPVDTVTMTFANSKSLALFTKAFGQPVVVVNSQTFAQASIAQAIAAIKLHPKLAVTLATSTSVTL